jgi:CheY-like chemotaxis protein/HPt (histidine-containing phosphotransfer) domain-containing protein
LLASSQLNDEQRLYVDSIRRSVQSLGNVVEDILDYTRADAGRLVLHPQPFALRSVLADVVTLFTPAASEKHLALAFTIDDGVPPTLMGDPDRIRQLITNLVGNAVKFTDAGSVTIAVGVVSSSETEVVVRIAVRDTGIGIAAERVDRLFEPFEQGEGATWRRHGGTGLGLAICRQLVELMGGEISVESTIGFGSEFTATVRLTAVAPERMTVRVSVPRRTTIARRRPRVLVVEDNEVNQLLVDRQLTTLEYEAVVVPDGLTALERLRQESFDAVLLDVQMPGLDGLDVARVFRSEEVGVDVRTPVIAMTASAMAGDRDACLAAGMDDYLAKPVGIDALRAMLDRWVRHREALPMVDPAAPGGTLDSLVAELGGDRATVMQMACTFLTELPQRHDAIMLAPDAAAFAAATHTLASAAAALSLTGLFNACRAAEQAAKHSQQFDRPTHERAIEAAVARSKPTLEAWVAAKQ